MRGESILCSRLAEERFIELLLRDEIAVGGREEVELQTGKATCANIRQDTDKIGMSVAEGVFGWGPESGPDREVSD